MSPRSSIRRLAGLLACVLVLLGTGGAAVLDAAVHARDGAAAQRDGWPAGPHDQSCVHCVAASASAAPCEAAGTLPDGSTERCVSALPYPAGPDVDTPYLTPPARGPPRA